MEVSTPTYQAFSKVIWAFVYDQEDGSTAPFSSALLEEMWLNENQ